MATIYEYFENDLNYAVKLLVSFPDMAEDIEVCLLYDFSAFISYLVLYVPNKDRSYNFFDDVIKKIKFGASQVSFLGKVKLPSVRFFPGELQVINSPEFDIMAKFHGDVDWISMKEIRSSTRVLIYSEAELSAEDIEKLKIVGQENELNVSFRPPEHAKIRSRNEEPLAFISHDSRDKENVAKPIAIGLQKLLCPVWYDEFSLKVGDNLRTSIEAGLKKTNKCVLILSKSFLSNDGWTKKEFDSVITREILESESVILPVWCDVTTKEVYDYSMSLANIKGIDFNKFGTEETIKQLHRAIVNK